MSALRAQEQGVSFHLSGVRPSVHAGLHRLADVPPGPGTAGNIVLQPVLGTGLASAYDPRTGIFGAGDGRPDAGLNPRDHEVIYRSTSVYSVGGGLHRVNVRVRGRAVTATAGDDDLHEGSCVSAEFNEDFAGDGYVEIIGVYVKEC